VVSPKDEKVRNSLLKLETVILDQANCKELEILEVNGKPSFIRLKIKPKPSRIGVKFKDLTPKVIAALKQVKGREVERFLSEGKIVIEVDGKKLEVGLDDVEVLEETPEKVYVEEFEGGIVFVDTSLTMELLAEALAKEIVRRAQVMRKDMGLKIEDYVDVEIGFEKTESLSLIQRMENYVKNEVRIRNLKLVRIEDFKGFEAEGFTREWKIEEEKVVISLRLI
jgi:isoleucyl-tRNA synthetase